MRKFADKLKKWIAGFGNALRGICRFVHLHPTFEFLIFSVVMYFTVDILCRRSFSAPFVFAASSPIMLIFNFTIVAFTMSLSLLFSHRYFFYLLNAVFWLTISITDFVLLGLRSDPFSAIDLNVVVTAIGVIPKYIGWGGIVLIIAAFAAAGVLLVILWKKHPKPVKLNRSAAALNSVSIALTLCIFTVLTSYTGYIPSQFDNALSAYDDYGFPYCFFRSFILRGVSAPDEYSEDAVKNLMQKLGEEKTGKTGDELPNVIFLQLESFFDVNKVKNLEISENPIPVFTSLKKSCPTGKFSVNTIGGGTANTEFEVLCGMNLVHFGLLECPYTTILYKTPCQSAASVLSEAGLSTHAIHNHVATFYSRNLVYANLGFDTFTPLEYIKNAETNLLGWAKDSVLTSEIIDSLNSTEGRDFVFTVSVQPHGRYPDYETALDEDIQVLSYTDPSMIFEIEYYINQIHETDAFLGELLKNLEDYPENVVLVVYGDHLPTLGLEAENMFDGDIYSTEYVVWSNFGFECKGGDIQAFQLTAKIFDALDVSGGNMFRIHKKLADDENYDAYMKLMEYDMLKGKNYASGGKYPEASDLRLGTLPISITSINSYGDVIFVSGKNFTKDSFVFVNERRYDTVYISDSLLLAKDITPEPGDEVYVAQLSEGSTLLSHTESWVYDSDVPDTSGFSDIVKDGLQGIFSGSGDTEKNKASTD